MDAGPGPGLRAALPGRCWTGSFSRDADTLGAWYAHAWRSSLGSPPGPGQHLLAEADRLAALAELVGVAAMPGAERMVMLGGRLLREGVLQQNALSPNEAFCSPEKGAALLDAVLTVIDRCDELVGSGVPAAMIEETDFGDLLRAAQETGPDEVVGVQRRLDVMLTRLERLS